MKHTLSILSVLVVAFIILSCKQDKQGQSNRFEKSSISMEKEACYGTCPVYNITITGTGKVHYEGKDHVERVGRFEKQLSPKEISVLFNAYECANFFDFHEEYTEEVTDLPTTWITFEHRGFKKKVKDYYGAPEELKKLEKMVEDVALSKEGWTKAK